MGPYNPLENQLTYAPDTGQVLEWYKKPYNKVDDILLIMIFVMI